jgi:hypothetical protein
MIVVRMKMEYVKLFGTSRDLIQQNGMIRHWIDALGV